jgi:hypothetical protein
MVENSISMRVFIFFNLQMVDELHGYDNMTTQTFSNLLLVARIKTLLHNQSIFILFTHWKRHMEQYDKQVENMEKKSLKITSHIKTSYISMLALSKCVFFKYKVFVI